MSGFDKVLPPKLAIYDIHTHLGTYSCDRVFPWFYLNELCRMFPVKHLIWAPFSWEESVAFLHRDPPDISPPALPRTRRWLWVSPVREAGLKLLTKRRIPQEFAGIKLHPEADRYDLTASLVRPVIDAAERWKVPIAIHTGNAGCNAGRVSRSFPSDLTCPLILFHSRPIAEATAVASRRSNIYLEFSFSPSDHLARGYDAVGDKRIVFGSDYPAAALYYNGIDVLSHYALQLSDQIEAAERLGITESFFYGNALRLFQVLPTGHVL